MKLAHLMMAAAAMGMAATPALAAPAGIAASSLSIGGARVATSSPHKSKLAGGGALIALIGAIVVIGGIVVVAKNSDKPASP
ncbi:hypothetical protein [Sphingomonas bacterium]|uniref:hypothetical protein n=1 Tax=Sphingomonas bacterium TaxID=1895847 RepID=UPI0020C64A64|nr:hypothetical protein [Sphingomonas bacterium]